MNWKTFFSSSNFLALCFAAMASALIAGGYEHGWGWLLLIAALCVL